MSHSKGSACREHSGEGGRAGGRTRDRPANTDEGSPDLRGGCLRWCLTLKSPTNRPREAAGAIIEGVRVVYTPELAQRVPPAGGAGLTAESPFYRPQKRTQVDTQQSGAPDELDEQLKAFQGRLSGMSAEEIEAEAKNLQGAVDLLSPILRALFAHQYLLAAEVAEKLQRMRSLRCQRNWW